MGVPTFSTNPFFDAGIDDAALQWFAKPKKLDTPKNLVGLCLTKKRYFGNAWEKFPSSD